MHLHEVLPWVGMFGAFVGTTVHVVMNYSKQSSTIGDISTDMREMKGEFKELGERVRSTEICVARIEAKIVNGSQ